MEVVNNEGINSAGNVESVDEGEFQRGDMSEKQKAVV
jgi:hypothetical protein